MHIAVLTPVQRQRLADALTRAEIHGNDVGLAFDPMDMSIKWKTGTGPWSAPIVTTER
jgi:hypothetical protein